MSAQAAAGAVPAFLAQDTATREWLAHYDHTSRFASWHPADVEWALGEAHRLLRSLGGRIGPASAKGFWPATVPDPGEYREASKARRAEASEVTLMNFALGWAWAYLSDEAAERRAVQDWCYCKEFGLSLRTFYKERGLHRTTEQLHRRRGLLFIAARLCRAGVPIPRDVLIARLEGKRSELRHDVDALAQAARDGSLAAQEAPQAAAQPVRPTVGRAPPAAEFWRACEAAQELGAGAFVDAVFGLIFERTRIEAEAGDLAPTALSDRSARLTAEAIRRGLLPPGARPRPSMARDELTARIESNKEAAPAGEGSHA